MKKNYFLFLILGIIVLLFTGCATLNLNAHSDNITNSKDGNIDVDTLLNEFINKIDTFEYYQNQLIVGYTNDEAFDELKRYLKAFEEGIIEFEKDTKVALLTLNISVKDALLKLKTYNDFDGIRYIEPSIKDIYLITK